MAATPRTTVVLGLGNPILGDDAVGLCVADAVQGLLAEHPVPGVEVRTSERAGLDLIPLLAGAARAVIVDSIQTAKPRAGQVHRLSVADLPSAGTLAGAHDVSLADALTLARMLGAAVPESVEIYAVEGASVATLSQTLSAPVAAVVAPLARRLHARLKRRERAPRKSNGKAVEGDDER
jgi:hydrogenase maturation protease